MAGTHVNPTRMELTRLKKRLVTARRGHKLLKDKRDELMRQFLETVREVRQLRRQVEKALLEANRHMSVARALMNDEAMAVSMLYHKQEMSLDVGEKNIMSVRVPLFDVKYKTADPGDIYSYGFAFTSSELDEAVLALSDLTVPLLRLAEKEKACNLMALEIEKTRRRVNALEHVMIPGYLENIRFITMKLDETERSSITRLMKVKDMMIEKTMEARRLADERSPE